MSEIIYLNYLKYPKLLKTINDPPEKLYYKGKWDDNLFKNCLAVVGSRRISIYGLYVVRNIVYKLASRGVTVVSGFMHGVDIESHKVALLAGGKTIAVMPCGIETVYPRAYKNIHKEIIEKGGLVISEYGEKEVPRKWTFPKRNRIVAGISKALLVVEAQLGSGSLVTASLSSKYNRKIFAVPGQINSLNSAGTLKLIKEGADVVVTGEEVINFFGTKDSGIRIAPEFGYKTDVELALGKDIITFDELVIRANKPSQEISSELTKLILTGKIIEEGGMFYASGS